MTLYAPTIGNYAKTNKEKSISQMFDAKSKSIQKMADRKLNSMELANVLNAAKDLIIAFPDNWKEKLDELILCAQFIIDVKEDNFFHSLEMLKKLKHGGIMTVGEDVNKRREYEEDYDDHNIPAEPF